MICCCVFDVLPLQTVRLHNQKQLPFPYEFFFVEFYKHDVGIEYLLCRVILVGNLGVYISG